LLKINSLGLRVQIYLISIDLEIGKQKAEAMFILFQVWQTNEKICQNAAALPVL
jgi:hypothetical protein